jgi:hypothetical protein
MNEFEKMIVEIEFAVGQIDYDNGDISDIGNEIGYAIGRFIKNDEDINDFITGLKHGVSLRNGTH